MANTLRKNRRRTYRRKYVRVRKRTALEAAAAGLGLAGLAGAFFGGRASKKCVTCGRPRKRP